MSPAAKSFWTWWVVMTFSGLLLSAFKSLVGQVKRDRALRTSIKVVEQFQGWMIAVMAAIIIWWIWS